MPRPKPSYENESVIVTFSTKRKYKEQLNKERGEKTTSEYLTDLLVEKWEKEEQG